MSAAVLEKQPDPLAHRVTTGLLKIGLAVRRRSWKEAGPHRISPTQGQILAFLQARPRRPATLSAIARAVALTAGTVCEAVRALEKKGMVRKARGATDARAVFITLSPKGRRKAKQASAWPDFLTEAAERLRPEERRALLRVFIKLIRTLQERGELPAERIHASPRGATTKSRREPR